VNSSHGYMLIGACL